MTITEQLAESQEFAESQEIDALEPGEGLDVEERLIVAPAVGIFRPLAVDTSEVACGQAIGTVESVGAEPRPVNSPHAGWLQGLLAKGGERVRAGQPVAWLRAVV